MFRRTEPKPNISDACECLEGRRSFRYTIKIYSSMEALSVEMERFSVEMERVDNDGRSSFVLSVDDVEEWKRLGRAINGTDVIFLFFEGFHRDPNPAAVRCAAALFQELTHNNSIQKMTLTPSSMLEEQGAFDLRQFLLNNRSLRQLKLASPMREITPNEARIISRAITNVHLKRLDCRHRFERIEVFEPIVLACTKVQTLTVRCGSASHYQTLAQLLRNPSTELESLITYTYEDCLELEDSVNILSASLLRNTKLKEILVTYDREIGEFVGSFDKVLCDVSTIQSIYGSNHTLEDIKCYHTFYNPRRADYFSDECTLSELTQRCLDLNKNANKSEVIRSKILQYYFVGDFDVGPFTSMPASVVPVVMHQIQGVGKLSAIFRLLKSIPELCNVSGRSDRGQPGTSNWSGSPDNKRQKVAK